MNIWRQRYIIIYDVIAIGYAVISLIEKWCAFVDQRAKHISKFFDHVDKDVFPNFIR